MKNSLASLSILILLAGCQAHRASGPSSQRPVDYMIAGRPLEVVLHDVILVTDKDLQGKQFYEPRYLTASDGRGGAYVALSSAFGKAKSYGPRYTWLYHAYGQKLHRMFRYPFDATELQGTPSPVVKGAYWAYECTMCDAPEAGYLQEIPVKLSRHGTGWRIVVDLPAADRARIGHEAHLVVDSAMAKYGDKDPETRRMHQQIARFFPLQSQNVKTASTVARPTPRMSRNQ